MQWRGWVCAWTMFCATAVVAGAPGELPAGFSVTTLVEGLEAPIALAPAPDGRLFVALRDGRIVIVRDGAVQDPPFAELPVYTLGECGLLGLALDHDFAGNGLVYAFASVSANEQQVLRLADEGGIAARVDVLRGNLPTSGSNHNGGGIKVGPDGMIYFAIGDNGVPENGQQLSTLAGKVCRMAPDGPIPADNPFVTPSGSPRAVWALGFRNPFRMCISSDGRLFVGDVGSSGDSRREELNLVVAGSNYGWPAAEGFVVGDNPMGFLDPVLAYADEGSSIAGCAIYEATQFPEEYRGDVFHLDHVSGGVFRAHLANNVVAGHELFYQAEGGPVDLVVDRDGNLLYAELFTGRVRKITYPAFSTVDPIPEPGVSSESTPQPAHVACGTGAMAALCISFFVCVMAPKVGAWRGRYLP